MTLYIGGTPFATITDGVAPFAIITGRGIVYIRVGVVGYGTIAKVSNAQRYIKGLTAVPYIRRLSVSIYMKEGATVSAYISIRLHHKSILTDGTHSGLYKRLNPTPIYTSSRTPLLYIRGYTPLLFICTPHTNGQSYKNKKEKGDRENEFCEVF